MTHTDEIREQIKVALEGCEPNDVAIVFYEQLVALIGNDPEYFSEGRGNALAKTLEWSSNLVKEASR